MTSSPRSLPHASFAEIFGTSRVFNSSITLSRPFASELHAWHTDPTGAPARKAAEKSIFDCWLHNADTLSVKDRNLDTLPMCIAQLKSVVTMDLSGNPELSQLPDLSSMPRLTALTVDAALCTRLGGSMACKLPAGCKIIETNRAAPRPANETLKVPATSPSPPQKMVTPSALPDSSTVTTPFEPNRRDSNDASDFEESIASSRRKVRFEQDGDERESISDSLVAGSMEEELRKPPKTYERLWDASHRLSVAIETVKEERHNVNALNKAWKQEFRSNSAGIFIKHPELRELNIKGARARQFAFRGGQGMKEVTRQLGKKLFGIGREKKPEPASVEAPATPPKAVIQPRPVDTPPPQTPSATPFIDPPAGRQSSRAASIQDDENPRVGSVPSESRQQARESNLAIDTSLERKNK